MDSKLFSSILIVFLVKLFTNGLPIYGELYEGSNCKLENGMAGVCKKINECPTRLREVMEGKRSSDSVGRCGFKDFTEIVCCQLNITEKIGVRPAETACRQYENEIETQDARMKKDIEVQFNIFAGLQAGHGEFPYMVALGYENQDTDDNNSVPIRYNCGGTLISSQHVLTAAHCVNNVQRLRPVEVRIGSVDLKSVGDGERILISDVIPHPQYRLSQNYHDVAILKLRRPISKVSSDMRPICMQTKSLDTMEIPQATEFVVIGWGATSFDEDRSSKLMKTPSLRMVDRESCAKSFTGFSKLPNGLDGNMLCAIDTNVTRRSDACQGDSGGPLLMLTGPNHSIVGITAFGQSCGGSVPGIYTAVYSYLDWIEEHVWPEMID